MTVDHTGDAVYEEALHVASLIEGAELTVARHPELGPTLKLLDDAFNRYVRNGEPEREIQSMNAARFIYFQMSQLPPWPETPGLEREF